MDTTDGVYYLGFQITDLAVLKPMQRIFENIKKGIWSDEEQYRVVHRVKFNRNFKHIRLCSAKVGNHEFPKLVDAFKVFTEDHAEELQTVRARFSELQCEHLNGRIRVSLTLCPESFKMISDLQNEVIAHFKEFQDTETTWRFDLRCRLLSLNTVIPFDMVEEVVTECSSEVKNLDAPLGPFMLESQRRTLCQCPPLTPALSDVADDVPEWVPRSLCVLGFSEGDPSEIFRSIAQWSWFDLEADATRDVIGKPNTTSGLES